MRLTGTDFGRRVRHEDLQIGLAQGKFVKRSERHLPRFMAEVTWWSDDLRARRSKHDIEASETEMSHMVPRATLRGV